MTWILPLLGVGGAIGLGNWRHGVLFLLLVGFLQDPIRKVMPEFPAYTQVTVLMFLGIVVVLALLQNARPRWLYLYGGDPRLKEAWNLFILLVVIQCGHTYVLHGNPVLAGLGFVTYGTPVAAIMFGVAFANDETWIRRFFLAYLCLAVPIVLTVYLSFYLQDQWDVLKSLGRLAGNPLLIFDQGTVLYSNSGLMRVGEVAAWHAGTAVMMLIMMATSDRRLGFRIAVGIVVALLIGAIILTGRRKMVMAVAIFLAVFVWILMIYWRGINRVGALMVVLAVCAAAYAWLQPEEGEVVIYAARTVTVFEDAMDRVIQAWGLVQSGYARGGFFGLGAGVAAQGAQYFGGGVPIVGGAAEGGGGKLIVELGIIGMLVVAQLVWRLVRHFHAFLRLVPAGHEYLSVYLAGITAMLAANVGTFLVASQLFGDPFILLLIGFFISFLFALERMVRGL